MNLKDSYFHGGSTTHGLIKDISLSSSTLTIAYADKDGTSKTISLTGIVPSTSDFAKLLKPIADTTTASASTWSIPSGSKQVWGEKFSDSTLKYTPSGGSETTITDTGDLVMFLTPSATENKCYLNIRIDGTFYGALSGNASSATSVIVNQNNSANNTYPLVWTNLVNNSTQTANLLYKSYLNLYYNPSTKLLYNSGLIKGNLLESTVASGTAPLVVASNTKVDNLNADLLDGKHLTELFNSLTQSAQSITANIGGTSKTVNVIPKALKSKGTTVTTTAGETYGIAGSSTDNARIPTRWFVNLDTGETTLVDGMIIKFKIPVAGTGTSGDILTIDGNEAHFHPVVYNTNSLLTTHFAVNSIITVQYDANISAYPCGRYNSDTGKFVANGNTTTAIAGVWRVLACYDSGNTDVRYLQTIRYPFRTVATGGAIRRYTLCMLTPDGKITSLTTTDNKTDNSKTMFSGYLNPGKVYYYNHTDNFSAGANISGEQRLVTHHGDVIDARYTFNCGTTLTQRASFYIVGTIDNNGFKLDTTTPWSCSLPNSDDGKVYIYVGMVYPDTNGYRISLEENNTIYQYKDGGVKIYSGYSSYSSDSDKLDGQHGSYYATLSTAQTITGLKTFATNQGTTPVKFQRNSTSVNEYMNLYVTDASTVFDFNLDEVTAEYTFKGTWTDTENSNGSKAGNATVRFMLSHSDKNIYLDYGSNSYRIAHQGNVSTGDANGQIKIAGTNVNVKGLGSNAYTSTTYIPLAGTSTSAPITGTLYSKAGLYIYKDANSDVEIWHIDGDSTAWNDKFGFTLKYLGSNSANDNDLVLYSHNLATGNKKEVYKVHQDGQFIFGADPYVSTNKIAHAGNVTSAGATIGTSDTTIATIAGVDIKAKIADYLLKSGGQMTGPLTWKDITALPEQTSPKYFLCIDAFASGCTTKWTTVANVKTALGLGSNAYTSTSYLPLTGGRISGNIYFTQHGSETYTLATIFVKSNEGFIIETPRKTNAADGEILPFYIRTRGGNPATVNAESFIKNGGTSSLVLMADGSTTTLQTSIASTNTDTQVPTAKAVYTAINNLLGTSDALVYKGTLAGNANNTNGGTLTPAASKGWVYKVTQSGYINGTAVEVGDMLICNTDNTPAATTSGNNIYSTVNTKWDFIQANLDPNQYVTVAGIQSITGEKTFTKANIGLLYVTGLAQFTNVISGSINGNAATTDKLKNARTLKVNLATTTAQSFNGSANAEAIGVSGILPTANGGTGNANGTIPYTKLTGSTTTANQAIVSSGTANGWTLKTLGSNAFNSTAYLPLTGGTVTGTLTLSKTSDLSGTADNSPALIICPKSGSHLELDGNEILAKETATTVNSLYLNSDGGDVYIKTKLAAHAGNVGTGDNNGQVKIAGTNVTVKGINTAAYTESTNYILKNSNTTITWTDNLFIDTNKSVDAAVSTTATNNNNSFKFTRVSVNKGDKFLIKGRGGKSPRLYAFVDSDNKLKTKADDTLAWEGEYHEITAGLNGFLIVNIDKNYASDLIPISWVSGFLTRANSTVTGGGSTWGNSITVNIGGVSKTLTIPSKPTYTLDDVTDGSSRKLANYLPKTGGTLTNTGSDVLTINRTTAGSIPWIRFYSNNTLVGYLGVSSTKVASFNDTTNTYTLAHSGNSTQSAVTLTWGTNSNALKIAGTLFNVVLPSNPDRYVNSARFAMDADNGIKMTLTRAGADTSTVTATIAQLASTTGRGLTPKLVLASTDTIATQASEYVLTYKSGTETTPVWRKLPANAWNNTTNPTWTSNASDAAYPIGFCTTASPTSGNRYNDYYNTMFTFNPSTKSLKIDGCTLQYDSTNKCLKFIFTA